MFKAKRLSKELAKIHDSLPPGIFLVSAPDLNSWDLDISVLDPAHPIYNNQTFRLRMRFSDKYPIEAPECFFVLTQDSALQRPIPLHPHIYSNGIICLDLLGSGWSPVHNVESICVSLQSMLAGNEKAERPEGDEQFCRRVRPGQSTRGIGFMYDDANV